MENDPEKEKNAEKSINGSQEDKLKAFTEI